MRTLIAVLVVSRVALAGDPALPFEKYQLPNGLTVILSEDHRLPHVAVNVWYHVGAANQTPGRAGFAHLFEHMLFSGSKHSPGSGLSLLSSMGASGPENANGTTNFDRTNYFEVVPSNQLTAALWFESDRMGFLLDALDEKKLEVQRNVVSNELRRSYENTPYAMGRLKICNVLYPAPHPYFSCVIGTVPEVQQATVPELKRFYLQFYGASNASLSIVGDFDPREVKATIAQYFSTLPSGPRVERPSASLTPPLTGVTKTTIVDAVATVPRLVVVWNGVTPFSADEAAGDVLASILGQGSASRLHREAVVTSRVASAVYASNESRALRGTFEIASAASVGRSAADQLAPIQKVIDELKARGPTQAEVDRAKRGIEAQLIRRLERAANRADRLNQYQTMVGDPGYLPQDLARYRAVTVAEVQAFARQYLKDDARLELTQVPRGKP